MRFGVYSEHPHLGDRPYTRHYQEVLEQIAHADRLGFDRYSTIEHFSFEKFGAMPDPLMLFAAAGQKTSSIVFRTLVHVLPPRLGSRQGR